MIFKKFPKIVFTSSKISDGNMSLLKGDSQKALENRKKFFKKIGIDIHSVVEVKQTHTNKIINVKKPFWRLREADGLITNKADIYLMIKAADCHQIAFYDPNNQAIALIHAGWRGLENGIIAKTIKKMSASFKTLAENLIVNFGPSIGPCCYRMDIWKQAENQLLSLGILKENINNPKVCTFHTKKYFSHRRAEEKKEQDFRFITILGIKTV